ncbi:DUF6882 domain-containing protein [Amycolatopsis sp. YIM 10]|uniref:DUF6882 domain-containing protein n=1 Tax=Amycolatopsis sp. YIM 10 TaxID=2653857 RepID=UPI0012904BC9|nr:DUF6882 domain-containing protein [Amycolatopsis sp. YIM 10]QFU90406.1 hypothetical protein YIM_26160 [Amycolatopsis sp. YIM 10]
MPTFLELQDDAALLSFEHQLHLSERVGEHSWRVDLAQPLFEFSGENPLVCERVHLLGSAAPGPGSWLWAWANPFGYRPEVLGIALAAKEFGERHGIPELAEAEIPFDALPGSPTEPAQVASLMMEAAKVATGRWSGYQGPVGGGTRAGFLVEHPELSLPPATSARTMRVLQQGVMELTLHDHRRAFGSYAVNRGLEVTEDGPMWISGPDFRIAVEFNEQNLMTKMSATLGASS